MRKFYICENNGVTALVTEEVYDRLLSWKENALSAAAKDIPYPAPLPSPIFIFSDHPGLQSVSCGDMKVFKEATDGYRVLREGTFAVPFSNCGGDIRTLSHEELLTELETRPSGEQILRAFDLMRVPFVTLSADEFEPVASA